MVHPPWCDVIALANEQNAPHPGIGARGDWPHAVPPNFPVPSQGTGSARAPAARTPPVNAGRAAPSASRRRRACRQRPRQGSKAGLRGHLRRAVRYRLSPDPALWNRPFAATLPILDSTCLPFFPMNEPSHSYPVQYTSSGSAVKAARFARPSPPVAPGRWRRFLTLWGGRTSCRRAWAACGACPPGPAGPARSSAWPRPTTRRGSC